MQLLVLSNSRYRKTGHKKLELVTPCQKRPSTVMIFISHFTKNNPAFPIPVSVSCCHAARERVFSSLHLRPLPWLLSQGTALWQNTEVRDTGVLSVWNAVASKSLMQYLLHSVLYHGHVALIQHIRSMTWRFSRCWAMLLTHSMVILATHLCKDCSGAGGYYSSKGRGSPYVAVYQPPGLHYRCAELSRDWNGNWVFSSYQIIYFGKPSQ